MNDSFHLYRTAGTDNPTHLDLILAVYDALARDLNRIADAVAVSDVEVRCRWSHHAWLLLGYLETWVGRLQEPELERSLNAFYAYLRAALLRLQASRNEADLRDLAMMVCEMRAVWQQKQGQLPASSSGQPTRSDLNSLHVQDERPKTAWSA